LGEYFVHVAPGLLAGLSGMLDQAMPRRPRVVIADDRVAALFPAAIAAAGSRRLTFAAGESSKTRSTWSELSDELLASGLGRDGGLVAFGGGVTGDLAGFVAATYLRGLPYAQVPTTLLAMVDASVGGKVGVDTRFGKNLIGAFHPPAIVAADPETLLGLPEPTYRAGLAETVKHGLIGDAGYFEWIEANAAPLLARDLAALTQLVGRSVEFKAEVVSRDERESGRREILNAGHTVAHALEQASGYALPHGEAVAIGLVIECRIGARLGVTDDALSERVGRLLGHLGLPVGIPASLAPPAILAAMETDKKKRADTIRMALPSVLGMTHRDGAAWSVPVPRDLILESLSAIG
jgi:3-dehydroquinate synthase